MAGAVTLAIMILPLIIRTTEEALISVPAHIQRRKLRTGRRKTAHDIQADTSVCCTGHPGRRYPGDRKDSRRKCRTDIHGRYCCKGAGEPVRFSKDTVRPHVCAPVGGTLHERGIRNSSGTADTGDPDQRCIGTAGKEISNEVTENGEIYYRKSELVLRRIQGTEKYNLNVKEKETTAFIGPSSGRKSTLLKSLNRMNDLVENCRIDGKVLLDGEDIYGNIDVNHLRKRVGMVFRNRIRSL